MQAWPQMLYSSMLPTMPNATNASLATNAAAAAAAALPRYIHTVIAALTQTLYQNTHFHNLNKAFALCLPK